MYIYINYTALLNAVECSIHPTSGGELFFNNDRCYAYSDRCQGKSPV